VSADEAAQYQPGAAVSVELFQAGQKVDVTGVTQGKVFAWHHQATSLLLRRPASHGNSRSHRVPGSTGMAQDPGRVFPGKRMAGHMGRGDVYQAKILKSCASMRSAAWCC